MGVTNMRGTLAASGGYYVTCFGPKIFAEEATITGSIGVFGTKPDLGPMFRRIGLHEELVALDDSATMTSMSHGWSDDQKGLVQGFVDTIYERFVGHVAQSRNMPPEQVLPIAGGRVWSGEQARQAGLVDEIGGLSAAMKHVAGEAGIADTDYDIRHMPRPKDFFEVLAQQMLEAEALFDVDERMLRRITLGRTSLDHFIRLVLESVRGGEAAPKCWAMLPAAIEFSTGH